eukprot:TRINITY_DN2422_c0_g2_i1.p1 TRINITY_DN2422_c0_g2~~TRINITY_DN2422_c0_g2_i1.p1  ORF type:complete len:845 (-),score=113.59 TRINITY_DN2422_c0_g2_i1:652-3186(-)
MDDKASLRDKTLSLRPQHPVPTDHASRMHKFYRELTSTLAMLHDDGIPYQPSAAGSHVTSEMSPEAAEMVSVGPYQVPKLIADCVPADEIHRMMDFATNAQTGSTTDPDFILLQQLYSHPFEDGRCEKFLQVTERVWQRCIAGSRRQGTFLKHPCSNLELQSALLQSSYHQDGRNFREMTFMKALAMLMCLIATSTDWEVFHGLDLDGMRVLGMRILGMHLFFRQVHFEVVEDETQWKPVFEVIQNFQPIWIVFNAMLRSSHATAVFVATEVLSLVCSYTSLGNSSLSWDELIEPMATAFHNMDRRLLEREARFRDESIIFEPLKGIEYATYFRSVAMGLDEAMRYAGSLDDQELLNHIASSSSIRSLLVKHGTSIWIDDGALPIVGNDSCARALTILLAPPINSSDGAKMALWEARLKMFDLKDVVQRLHSLLTRFLDPERTLYKDIAKAYDPTRPETPNVRPNGQFRAKNNVLLLLSSLFFCLISIAKSDQRYLLNAKLPSGRSIIQDIFQMYIGQPRDDIGQRDSDDRELWQYFASCTDAWASSVIITTTSWDIVHVMPTPFISVQLAYCHADPRGHARMTDLQRVQSMVGVLRDIGNNTFRNNGYLRALHAYSWAIEILGQWDANLRLILLSNRCQANLMLRRGKDALRDANLALKIDQTHEKTLRRKLLATQMIQSKTEPAESFFLAEEMRKIQIVNQSSRFVAPSIVIDTPLADAEVVTPTSDASDVRLSNKDEKALNKAKRGAKKKQRKNATAERNQTPKPGTQRGYTNLSHLNTPFICGACLQNSCDMALSPCGHVYCSACLDKAQKTASSASQVSTNASKSTCRRVALFCIHEAK